MKYTDEILIELLDMRVELEKLNEAEMIDLIREVMERKLFIKYGATSMFDFLTHAHYSYGHTVAQRKIEAARLLRDFCFLKEWIAAGEVSATQLAIIGSAVNKKDAPLEIRRQILNEARNQTIENTQRILNEVLQIEVQHVQKVREQSDKSRLIQVTMAEGDWENLNRAKDILSHSFPDGDLGKVIGYCTGFTVRKKTTSVRRNIPKGAGIPFAIRCDVFDRDGSCRFQHENGTFCCSTFQLQVDHIISLWLGGGNNLENLQLHCGVHNRLKYEKEIAR